MVRLDGPEIPDVPGFDHPFDRIDVGHGEMAVVDVGEGPETFLCLHGEPTWGYLYRKMVPGLAEIGRVVVPDFLGFGRSDRFDDPDAYSYDMHLESLLGLVEALDLTDVTLVGQDWGGVLGLRAATVDLPDRFARIVAMNTFVPDGTQSMPEEWHAFREMVEAVGTELSVRMLIEAGTARDVDEAALEAYEAPFPAPEHKWGAVRWPGLVPTEPDDPGAASQAKAKEALKAWDKPFLVCFGDSDPITGAAAPVLRKMVPTADREPETWIDDAGHFLQEDGGEQIAEEIRAFVERRPLD